MTSPWKTFGRRLEIIVVALLVVAVAYLWVNVEFKHKEAPQVSPEASAATDSVESPDPFAPTHSAGTRDFRQPEELQQRTETSQPVELDQPGQERPRAAGSTFVAGNCDSLGTSPSANLDQPQNPASPAINEIRIATMAPEESMWVRQMRAAADEIRERTNGRVKIRYYTGGIMGSDSRVLTRIRIGQLQGGVFTPSAFHEIYPDLGIYGLPLLFQSADEAAYVRNRVDGWLRQGLREAGFESFGFAATGFSMPMSNDPIRNIDDLKGKAVWVPEGEPVSYQTVKALGGVAQPLPLADVSVGLQTELIDVVLVTPSGAFFMQWNTRLKFVTALPLIYTMGFMAIDIRAFDSIDAADQKIFTEVMTRVYCQFDKDGVVADQQAYDALLKTGMQSVAVDDIDLAKIQGMVEASNWRLVDEGPLSKNLYEELLDYVWEYRGQPQGQ